MPFVPSSVLFLNIIMPLMFMMSHRYHLLMILLYLELVILSMTIMLILFSSAFNFFYLLVLLTLGACEASLGLALLVSMSRTYGTDLVNSLTINKC